MENVEKFSTFVDLGVYRSKHSGSKSAYNMLKNGTDIDRSFSFSEIDKQARCIAVQLQQDVKTGDRALLLFHTGLDFVAAFLGCLYAGVIAVPVHFPSRREKDWVNVSKIAEDANVATVLSVSKHTAFINKNKKAYSSIRKASYIEIDTLDSVQSTQWYFPDITEESLAFLQYTSGSTGDPKGVMVTHKSLLHNQEMMRKAYQHNSETVIVSWLPLYHDMGLIGNVLHTLYLGSTCYLMTPVTFLQQPLRWLQAMSTYKAHSAFAPNFAYQLCLRNITHEERDTLNLSHWKMALNGAEPVRADTLRDFSEFFSICGFKATASYPAYGLAEATLFVSGSDMCKEPHIVSVKSKALHQHKIELSDGKDKATQLIVSSGLADTEQDIAIVNPDTFKKCDDGLVGEVWVSGPSIASGYWNRPKQTEETFAARIITNESNDDRQYLRTGDLGFILNGNIFITGRIKDMIVINGSNYYSHDIEKAIQDDHPALKTGSGAAFGIDTGDREAVVIVQEIERVHLKRFDEKQIYDHIRTIVAEQFQSSVHAIVLIKPMTLPLTSSGKIQRRKCKLLFLENSLSVVSNWHDTVVSADELNKTGKTSTLIALDKLDHIEDKKKYLKTYIQNIISSALNLKGDNKVKSRDRLFDIGLDSMLATELKVRIENELQRNLSSTLLLDYPTLEKLVDYLSIDLVDKTAVVKSIKNTIKSLDTSIENNLMDDEIDALLSEDRLTTALKLVEND